MRPEDRLVQRSIRDLDDGDKTELILMRAKLEVRSWFLRASLALNTALIGGAVVQLLSRVVFK